MTTAALANLNVIADVGGECSPYFEGINRKEGHNGPVVPPVPASPADTEAAVLPGNARTRTPGDGLTDLCIYPGLARCFIVGDDDGSRIWLKAER